MRLRLSVFLIRALLAALVWSVLTGGAVTWDALLIGIPAVAAAAAVSTAVLPATGWSWGGAVRFAVYFVRQSLRGGVDVARRALDPRMPLDPGVVYYEFDVKPDLARVAVANTTSLLPGSLVVDLDDRGLWLHALDAGDRQVISSAARTERRVADLLRVPGGARAEPAEDAGR